MVAKINITELIMIMRKVTRIGSIIGTYFHKDYIPSNYYLCEMRSKVFNSFSHEMLKLFLFSYILPFDDIYVTKRTNQSNVIYVWVTESVTCSFFWY